MKKLNRIFAAVISAAMLLQPLMPCAMADTVAMVDYVFSTQKQGVADGTITVSGIPEDATKVMLYWGSDESTVLSDYMPVKIYTSAETVAYNEEALVLTNGAISYKVEGSRYIPENAKYIIAEITNADSTVTTVSQALTNTGFSDDDMLYSMFWISDTHARWTDYKTGTNLYKGFNIMREIADADDEKFKGVIVNGDMADQGQDYEYAFLENLIDSSLADDYPVYYNVGNHDIAMYGNTYCIDAINTRFDKLADMEYTFEKTDKWSYDTYINGQHYIFLASPYGTSYKLSDSQYEWLEAKLAEGDKSGAKNFLFTHLAAYNTTPGSKAGNSFNDSDNLEFEEIVKRHPNTVVMTSHVHLEMDSDMKTVLVKEDSPSYMDTSSLSYTNLYDENHNGTSNKSKYNAYGRYAQIYADKIVVRTMNFKKNQWVPRAEYVIPVDNSVVFDGEVSVSNNGEGLAAGNVLTAKLNGNDVDTSKYSCEWFISGSGSVGTGTTYTIETADKNVSLKITDNETGAYAYATTGVYSYTEPTGDDTETELTPPEMNNDNTVVENNGIINVTGNAGAENAGKDIMLVVAPKASYDNAATIKYINETTVGDDGGYTFKFKADIVSSDDFLMAKLEGQDVTNSVISVKAAGESDVDMEMTLSSDNIPSLSIVNKYLDNMEDVKVIIATYDANYKMLKAEVADFDMLFGAYGEEQIYNSETAAEGTYIKAFLWEDFKTINPLSQGAQASIPVTE